MPSYFKSSFDGSDSCRVCGDRPAMMHYGAVACMGCKGFFRRSVRRQSSYNCRFVENCVIDRVMRNSCRHCRFKKCLAVGMKPKNVQADREAIGRCLQGRFLNIPQQAIHSGEAPIGRDWLQKLPVGLRTILIELMNVNILVNSGDSNFDALKTYPLQCSAKQLLDHPALLNGNRTEMRYESFRETREVELPAIAHRGLLATIDWVNHLFSIMKVLNTKDKMTLVKHGFAPLSLLSIAVSTVNATNKEDVLCLHNFGCVSRVVDNVFKEPYHLANKLVDRCLNDLVRPLRCLKLKEEEEVLLKAILLLDPYLKPLSRDTSEAVSDLRDQIQETLYCAVRQLRLRETASSRLGNLLLICPTLKILGNVMLESLQYAQSFGSTIDNLMAEVLSDTNDASQWRQASVATSSSQNKAMTNRLSPRKI